MSNVEHPQHYQFPNGIEVMDIVKYLDFCRGNAVKYICRAGKKDPNAEIEDLQKAIYYCNEEIKRIKEGSNDESVI